MSNISIENQTIALAALHLAAATVQEIATRGTCNQDDLETCVGSLLKIDSDSALGIYGSLGNIHNGLKKLSRQLSGQRDLDPDLMRYTTSLIYLEKSLNSSPLMQKAITEGIEKATAQSEVFPLLHENIFASLGDLYQSTISTLQPRIIVRGEEIYLTNSENQNKIRTLLLAGIRAALLWRQCGGKRWKVIFQRRKIVDSCQQLLQKATL